MIPKDSKRTTSLKMLRQHTKMIRRTIDIMTGIRTTRMHKIIISDRITLIIIFTIIFYLRIIIRLS